MTDQELNEAVARKFGWEQETMNSFYLNYWKNPKTKLYSREPEDYCHSIAAAWEIVGQVFTSFYLSWDETTETWFVKWDNQHRSEESCRYKAEADTAPMAICSAFLKL